jgi:hypothetical protein
MLGLLDSYRLTPFLWVFAIVAVAPTAYLGVTILVALFHPDAARREEARLVLKDIITLFSRAGRRSGSRERGRV